MDKVFLIFGASITYGAWDEEGGWVARLRKFADNKNLSEQDSFYLVYNLGISGDTTEGLLKRFKLEAGSRLKEGKERVILFDIGINDLQFLSSQNNFRTSPQKFKENIKRLISLAKEISPEVIFIGPTPVDETKTTPIPWDENKFYKNDYLRQYDEIIKSVCQESKIGFVEIFNQWMQTDYKQLLDQDGLHPNSRGHERIFEMVKKFLVREELI